MFVKWKEAIKKAQGTAVTARCQLGLHSSLGLTAKEKRKEREKKRKEKTVGRRLSAQPELMEKGAVGP
jgi:hypothetical protein